LARVSHRTRPKGLNLKVRRASLKDLAVLVHQRRAMWTDLGVKDEAAHEKGDRDYERWAKTRLKKHQFFGWVVEDRRGKVAGGGCVWLQAIQPRPHRVAKVQPYLLSMYTEPEFRGLGVASMVVNAAIEWCKKNRYERLMLHASEMGRGVYKRLGFKRTWEMRLDLQTDGRKRQIRRTRMAASRTVAH
jgi:GNAT superfamily N-acetyltransferase